jgi:ABC-type phosphate/phosphonate transport system substrate-binding protein
MKILTSITRGLVAALLLAGGIAQAGPRDFVVQHAGVGGDTAQAAPYMEKFMRYAEEALGWPAGSADGQFFSEPGPAKAYIEEKKPGFGMLDPELYLEMQKSHQLQLIATVVGKNQSHGHLNLVVKDPALKSLDDLKGKTLVSSHFQSERYLDKVVFDGKIAAKKHFDKLIPAPSMLKGVKMVDRGEAAAVLLSDEEVDALKGMAYKDLRVLWTSVALPPMSVAVFGKNVSPKDREAMKSMLPKMCSTPKGGEVCKALDIAKFTPPDKAAYDAAQKKFAR